LEFVSRQFSKNRKSSKIAQIRHAHEPHLQVPRFLGLFLIHRACARAQMEEAWVGEKAR